MLSVACFDCNLKVPLAYNYFYYIKLIFLCYHWVNVVKNDHIKRLLLFFSNLKSCNNKKSQNDYFLRSYRLVIYTYITHTDCNRQVNLFTLLQIPIFLLGFETPEPIPEHRCTRYSHPIRFHL